MDHEVKPIKIQPILKEVIQLSHSIIPSTITIKSDIDRSCSPILADPVQIHQMLMNLITNAYHAMIETGGTLSIHLTASKPGNGILKNKKIPAEEYICLKIKDTGIGIAKDILPNIFDPYFTTTGNDKGTGLGLSVVHGIVKNTRGEIFVHSVPEQGTCFEIYLPVIEDTLSEAAAAPLDIPKGSERILLVDDEFHVTKIETRMLEHLGYQVTTSNDSKEALDLFLSQPDRFDILITDLTMPGLNGAQLSKKILEDCPDFPIIMCTGFSETLDEKTAKALGIKSFLMKPVILSDLAHTIRKILDTPEA
jgi:CheY-like chemotaxis protein